jgi:hypothetical protein
MWCIFQSQIDVDIYEVPYKLLQTGRSRDRFPMRSLDFSIYLIFPAALWPWGRLSLQQKWVPGIFLGVKGGRPARKAENLTAICEPIV